MLQMGLPKPLWDHSLELEALVHSCMSNNIYMTACQVPETIMTGNTADISHIAEFAWFDWVVFRHQVPGYPNNKMTLGRYPTLALPWTRALPGYVQDLEGQRPICLQNNSTTP